VLSWSSVSDRVVEAMATHGDWLASEVLAVEVELVPALAGETADVDGETIEISISPR
jgi:hypothetical protein